MALKAVQRQTEAVGKMDIREEKTMSQEKVIVLDFGGQYNQLIARRVRECHVYCEVYPHSVSVEEIRQLQPKGIIFTEIGRAHV